MRNAIVRGSCARARVVTTVMMFALLCACNRGDAGRSVRFAQSSATVEAYDFIDVTAMVGAPHHGNPFTDATLAGWFETADGRTRWSVDGFCDSPDGSVFRIRFAPPRPGAYRYQVEYRDSGSRRRFDGTFHATAGGRRGPIRVDSLHPWHFVWEGTGEHYYFNGTTAYWIFGWRDDSVITSTLDRLHRLGVNRVRTTIAGRSNTFFGEPVVVGPQWTLYVTPWPAAKPEDVYHPGFDYRRFHLPYWEKIERAVRYARDRDMTVSLVFDMNDSQSHPAAGSEDERRFLRYAVARLAAFSNVTWDLGDDLDGYRDRAWSEATGRLVQKWDPYKHLTTTHPRPGRATTEQARTSDWVGFTSFQDWSRTQHAFMLEQRRTQQATGRIIPQTNEEYGYEDHYPMWSPRPDAESADVLRRTAWDIAMAGTYQTTGETARRGTGIWPDAGGGWMNGRGDTTMTMLKGYAHMVDFFTSFAWWTAEPHDELVNGGNYCLATPGRTYAIYLPHGARAVVRLQPGRYRARWFDPRSGEWIDLPPADGPVWTSPTAPAADGDWALLLERAT